MGGGRGLGRPDAAAAASWEALRQGSPEVVAEVSALVISEGLYETAAGVSRELYALEQDHHKRQASRCGTRACKVHVSKCMGALAVDLGSGGRGKGEGRW